MSVLLNNRRLPCFIEMSTATWSGDSSVSWLHQFSHSLSAMHITHIDRWLKVCTMSPKTSGTFSHLISVVANFRSLSLKYLHDTLSLTRIAFSSKPCTLQGTSHPYSHCLKLNRKTYAACSLNYIIESEVLLKVAGMQSGAL